MAVGETRASDVYENWDLFLFVSNELLQRMRWIHVWKITVFACML